MALDNENGDGGKDVVIEKKESLNVLETIVCFGKTLSTSYERHRPTPFNDFPVNYR